ncbi:MAG: hypothetical protein AB7X49_00540 [Geminicoccaceae bacterium]
MAGSGLPDAQIAGIVGVDVDTPSQGLCRAARPGPRQGNLKVAENLYRKATGDGREAVTAAIFWMKARGGWREVNVHEIGGSETAEPIRIERVIVDPRNPELARTYVRSRLENGNGG